ncbi:unnamed protein product [Cylicocyclus nassatus]|uniref:Uncharacterized protein n=1 Tax=Cylicocyclus nassatus TaxID=53992 RepID=A0AA36GM93_CYLNA|nr:unnamed protein product [Cylicocyclus nassatus]
MEHELLSLMQFFTILYLMSTCSKKRRASSEATMEIVAKKEKVKAKVVKKPLRPLRSVGDVQAGRVTKAKLRDLGDEPSLSRSKVIGSSDQDSEKDKLPSPFSEKEKAVKRAQQPQDFEVERTPPSTPSSSTPAQEEPTQTQGKPLKVESAPHSLAADTPVSSTADNYSRPNTPVNTQPESNALLPPTQSQNGKEDAAAAIN